VYNLLSGKDAAERPLRSDDNLEVHLDNDLDNSDLDADFLDYSYSDADKYVNVTSDARRTQTVIRVSCLNQKV